MTSLEIFKRRDFLWDKNILEWKIRNVGLDLVRKQDVAKGGELEPKTNVFKICVKFYCGGAVKKLMYHRGYLRAGPPAVGGYGQFFGCFLTFEKKLF